MLSPYLDRILDPIHSLAATKLMLQRQVPPALPTPLANACRFAARQVLDLLQISFGEDAPHGANFRPRPAQASSVHVG
jgi:hypothetical protein